MSKFNRLTIVAAAEIIVHDRYYSHNDLDKLETQWGLEGRTSASSKSGRANAFARIAINEDIEVYTENGVLPISLAMVELAIKAPPIAQKDAAWNKLRAGLKYDGFEIVQVEIDEQERSPWEPIKKRNELRRMFPDVVSGLDIREAEDEVNSLLERHQMATARGHLDQAISNFGHGNWASANAMIRDFYQEILDKIAERLGCDQNKSDDAKRQYLAHNDSGPFLFHEYNEWENDRGKPSFVQGLWARLHPHGSHPGLSEEEDCAFRFQIVLISVRIFLRRFNKRVEE